ncbi:MULTISPECIES: guanylate kinase [Trueperella]|uniref:Guanylate kinase n=1 Tax=Trueperella bernardiae TaxID=59561 RepID=A0A0W1KMC8_9ACTO|nr:MULTISPECIES: guanylate kinase [Trueperella]KTF04982.1 Guanylate kinase [Trueperella bernardiae]MCM3906584.1 guanylate kinase [Trueperella bernardiae]MDK8601087.1 guanylate kinase [Trueperella bernardiae]MDV6238257.1 guanylate kinase [Trueperella bernardiae]OCW60950.1 guanylate kinase [Trueperella bernardiae]
MQAFVLTGPTAVGKGTVIAELRKEMPDLWFSISATTRAPRPGEVDGVNYFFVTHEEFDRLVAEGQMLEWAVVHGLNKYGTPRGPVDEALAQGRTVLLEVDLAGARQIRESMPEAAQIFLAPPSWEELEARLRGRGTESAEEQRRRLETAKVELAAEGEFDEVVVNITVAQATEDILKIMAEGR